jgi:hypothetical protein
MPELSSDGGYNGIMGVPITFLNLYNPDSLSLLERQKAKEKDSLAESGMREAELPNRRSTASESINAYSSNLGEECNGIMGVPITFMNKYNPDQFEILGSQRWNKSKTLLNAYTGDCQPPEFDKRALINGRETYDRIFIRYKQERKNDY